MRWLWLLCFGYCAAASGAEAPQRIASYSPGATQTLLDLGCSVQIVAATRWCPLPKAHSAIRTCDAFNPDLEALLQAKPDLVILPRLANPLWAERCTRAGLIVLLLNPEGPEAISQDLVLIGEATQRKTSADAWLQKMKSRAPAEPKTLLVIWDGMMAGPDAYTSVALKQAGFKSPLQAGTWVKLDWETLVKANPDAILWVESTPENGPITPSHRRLKELSEVIVVKKLKSVKAQRVFETTSGSDWLPGTGLLQASLKLTELNKSLQ